MLPQTIINLLIILHISLFCTSAVAGSLTLFTEDEMAQLNHPQNEWAQELDRYRIKRGFTQNGWVDELGGNSSIQDLTQGYSEDQYQGTSKSAASKGIGPIVSIIDPQSVGDHYLATIPVRLLIYLKGQQAPVNIDSLRVKGKRGIFSLNITKRIKEFLRQPRGTEDAEYVIDANIPKLGAGRYLITLSLADVKGNEEERMAFLEVVKD